MRRGLARWGQGLALGMMLIGSGLQGPAPARAAAPDATEGVKAWRDEIIYLILPDRFYNGDRSNDGNADPRDPFAYHGGDLAGILQKLDYLHALGVTALWLTPVSDNQDNPLMGKYWGYHGYWIQNIGKVDEHFGDERTFKELVRQAHARGMKVLLDAVVNHPGYDAPMVKDPRYVDWFHHNGEVTDWDDPYQNENYDIAGLPDFNSENAKVLRFMEDQWSAWIQRADLDGFRLDTVRHVPVPFWDHFTRTIHQRAKKPFFLVGEVSYHDAHKLPKYLTQGGLDSLFDFHMFETMREVFAKGRSARLLSEAFELDTLYPDPGMLSPFLDSHDEVRFLDAAGGDERRLRMALAFLFGMRGIPTVYYGTEVAMPGGKDPDNRRDMAWGTNPEMLDYTRGLIRLRKELAPLRRGTQIELMADDAVYGFTRRLGDDEVLVVVNASDRPQIRELTLAAASKLPDGLRLKNRLGSDTPVVKARRVPLSFQPLEVKILTR